MSGKTENKEKLMKENLNRNSSRTEQKCCRVFAWNIDFHFIVAALQASCSSERTFTVRVQLTAQPALPTLVRESGLHMYIIRWNVLIVFVSIKEII